MATEDHPLYPKWRAALERLIETKERLAAAENKALANTQDNGEARACLRDYDRAKYAFAKIADEI